MMLGFGLRVLVFFVKGCDLYTDHGRTTCQAARWRALNGFISVHVRDGSGAPSWAWGMGAPVFAGLSPIPRLHGQADVPCFPP